MIQQGLTDTYTDTVSIFYIYVQMYCLLDENLLFRPRLKSCNIRQTKDSHNSL